MNPQTTTGAIISLPDYRDAIASLSMSASLVPFSLPSFLDTQLGPVQMQGKIPACVSFSAVEVLKLYWFKKTGKWIDFSPRFLDILSAQPDIPLDGGRRPRIVFKLLNNVGCCTTALLPNDINLSIAQYRDPTTITQAMRDEAAKYKIPGFISVGLDFYTFRSNLYFFGAISTLFSVGQEMYIPSWLPKDTDPLRTPQIIESGHQMSVKGWSNNTLNRIRNEWSNAWGNNGETEYDAFKWSPYVHEAWAIAEIPTDISNFLKALPSPLNFNYQWNTNMVIGQFNDDIKFLQIALLILGFLKPILPEDLGHYGPKTASAVMAYQMSKGIYPTAPNSCGIKTRTALNLQFGSV